MQVWVSVRGRLRFLDRREPSLRALVETRLFVSFETNAELLPPQQTKTIETEHAAFQRALDILNAGLFDDELMTPMLVLQRAKNCNVYFCPERYSPRKHNSRESRHEIALNPRLLSGAH